MITTTIPDTTTPSIVILRAGTSVLYAATNVTTAEAADMLRRALIHLLATDAGLATIPAAAAIALPPTPDADKIPPLRVPRNLPKTSRPAKPSRPRRSPDPLDDHETQAQRDTW